MSKPDEFDEVTWWAIKLHDAGPTLDSELRQQFVDWENEEVTRQLLGMVRDKYLWGRQAYGETYAPRHAIDLLMRRGDADAIAEIARVLQNFEAGEHFCDEVVMVLSGRRTGAPLDDASVQRLWEVFDEMQEAEEVDPMSRLLEVFYEQRGPSDRLTEAFAQTGIRHPVYVREFLREYQPKTAVLERMADLLNRSDSIPPSFGTNWDDPNEIIEMLDEIDAGPPDWLVEKAAR